jgi:hypothetical protein
MPDKHHVAVNVEAVMRDLKIMAEEKRELQMQVLRERIIGMDAQIKLATVLKAQAEAELEGLEENA